MIDHAALLADLKRRVRVLEDDLRTRSAEVPEFATALDEEWQKAHTAERIGAGYKQWLDGEITQAAVAWILGTVFLRFCEDNELIELPYLAGPGERLAIAAERQQAFFEQNPAETDRDWIIAGFDALSKASPVAAGLFDRAHNPMWRITPSHDAAKALLAFWRTRGEDENSPVVHDFTDPAWNTRFLGDLYQDLSEHAKKTYALLQTPEFVEEFILDLTLKPAIDEFGLEPAPPHARPDLPSRLRVIDPACGSGHFLLSAFARLFAQWSEQTAVADPWVLIRNVLDGLHGVDKNPFAVSIARFRLLIATMKVGRVKHLADAPAFPLNIAVGDSLLHGRGGAGQQEELFGTGQVHTFGTEDIENYIKSVDILGANSYHVVVGNPPYFTARDSQESENYRRFYSTCSGKYTLSVPFTERFFHLARRGAGDRRGSGYVGQITTNAFMKRKFGKKLIEEYFDRRVELTYVMDSSGAHLPGFGVPTVILIGRNQIPRATRTIRTVMGIRGKAREEGDPLGGMAWDAMVKQFERPGSESEWISVTDLPRDRLSTHPWALTGGSAGDFIDQLVANASCTLGDRVCRVGVFGMTNLDDVMIARADSWQRRTGSLELVRRIVLGDELRDWKLNPGLLAFFPYGVKFELIRLSANVNYLKWLWPTRTTAGNRATFSKRTYFEEGRPWYEWHQITADPTAHRWTIAFAEMDSHNHFVLIRSSEVFKQSAPIIKLPQDTGEGDHLALLGILNSSTACFWLKHVSHNYGDKKDAQGARITGAPYFDTYDFTASTVKNLPLPAELPLELGQAMDALAQRASAIQPSAVCAKRIPTRERLDEARTEYDHIRGQMIALQEELDWQVYRLYALLTGLDASEVKAEPDSVPELKLGERAFEITLARKVAANEVETQWFSRHGSTPITEIPAHWPEVYRRVVERRIELIGKRRDIALIERPECKRRWSTGPWEKKEQVALRSWLLDRCESRYLWFALDDTDTEQPWTMTVNRLADRLRDDSEFVSVARLYAGQDAELSAVVAAIIDAEHVPYLAALRYKDTGLRKRRLWEDAWDLQRQEDATGERLNISVPPKYTSADFSKGPYWAHRGRLDVPKERFISYPQASPDGDGSLLLGWAGWDHRQQAHALMTIIEDRTSRDGWNTDRLVPLIAGLAEVLPWVRQWHGDIDPAFGMSPADAYAGYLEDQQLRHGVTASDLTDWRPQPSGRGRRPASSTAAASPPAISGPSIDPEDTQTRHTSTP